MLGFLWGWGRWGSRRCPLVGIRGAGSVGGSPFVLRHFHTNNILRVIAEHDAPEALCGPALSLQPSPLDADPEPFGDFTIGDTHRHPTPPTRQEGHVGREGR